MNLKCSECQKTLEVTFGKEYKRAYWLKLISYIDHEYYEEEITQATYEDLINCLMALKPEDECDHCELVKQARKGSK